MDVTQYIIRSGIMQDASNVQPECLDKVRRRSWAGTGFGFPRQSDGGTADVGHLRFGRRAGNQVWVDGLAGLNDDSKF